MKTIHARNVHQALPEALRELRRVGIRSESRNGPVLVHPDPVTTVYHAPWERVLFWPERDANPFFHLMESIWMMAGRDDVDWLVQFNKRMAEFSDDGTSFNGAYGHRWRHHFGVTDLRLDQLPIIIGNLTGNPECRRQVLGIWDPEEDLGTDSKDIPCNTQAMFQVRNGVLDMLVTNRSNDILWGCYGANAVHFSLLHEFISRAVGVPQGRYFQTSFNWHGYTETIPEEKFQRLIGLANNATFSPLGNECPYTQEEVRAFPILSGGEHWTDWLREASRFIELGSSADYSCLFFQQVAVPMLRTWVTMKKVVSKPERWARAQEAAMWIGASDWRKACLEWLQRRIEAWNEKQEG